jgi:hypothetical protein
MAQTGIGPATFRLVAQCLNQLRHRVPAKSKRQVLITEERYTMWKCAKLCARRSVCFLRNVHNLAPHSTVSHPIRQQSF